MRNIEIFYHAGGQESLGTWSVAPAGWYWWSCAPGCLPDSDPIGPFDTYDYAHDDAKEGFDTEETQ